MRRGSGVAIRGVVPVLAWATVVTAASGCGLFDEGGDGPGADPVYEILDEGTGPTNEQPLLLVQDGLVLDDRSVFWGYEEVDGRKLLRLVEFERTPVPSYGYKPARITWLSRDAEGHVYQHGRSDLGPPTAPVFWVPARVKVGMRWRSLVPGRTSAQDTWVESEVVRRYEAPGTYGPAVLWDIRRRVEDDEEGAETTTTYGEGLGRAVWNGYVALPRHTVRLVDAPEPARHEPRAAERGEPAIELPRVEGASMHQVHVVEQPGRDPLFYVVEGSVDFGVSPPRPTFIGRLYRGSARVEDCAQGHWTLGPRCLRQPVESRGEFGRETAFVPATSIFRAWPTPEGTYWLGRFGGVAAVLPPEAPGEPPRLLVQGHSWGILRWPAEGEEPALREARPIAGPPVGRILRSAAGLGELIGGRCVVLRPVGEARWPIACFYSRLIVTAVLDEAAGRLEAAHSALPLLGTPSVTLSPEGARLLVSVSATGEILEVMVDERGVARYESVARLELRRGEELAAALWWRDGSLRVGVHRYSFEDPNAPDGWSEPRWIDARSYWFRLEPGERRPYAMPPMSAVFSTFPWRPGPRPVMCWPWTEAPLQREGWTLFGRPALLEPLPGGSCVRLSVRVGAAEPGWGSRSEAPLLRGPVPGVGVVEMANPFAEQPLGGTNPEEAYPLGFDPDDALRSMVAPARGSTALVGTRVRYRPDGMALETIPELAGEGVPGRFALADAAGLGLWYGFVYLGDTTYAVRLVGGDEVRHVTLPAEVWDRYRGRDPDLALPVQGGGLVLAHQPLEVVVRPGVPGGRGFTVVLPDGTVRTLERRGRSLLGVLADGGSCWALDEDADQQSESVACFEADGTERGRVALAAPGQRRFLAWLPSGELLVYTAFDRDTGRFAMEALDPATMRLRPYEGEALGTPTGYPGVDPTRPTFLHKVVGYSADGTAWMAVPQPGDGASRNGRPRFVRLDPSGPVAVDVAGAFGRHWGFGGDDPRLPIGEWSQFFVHEGHVWLKSVDHLGPETPEGRFSWWVFPAPEIGGSG